MLANGAPDWCGIGKWIDACQLTVSLYCLFRFRQSFFWRVDYALKGSMF